MPPRYGKSQIVSKNFPAFVLGIKPSEKIIISSYSSELAEDFNIQIQELIDSYEYKQIFPNTKLKRSTRNKTVTTENGYVYAVGVGGTLTGKGAGLFICDDPIKGHAEAASKTHQKRLIDWYNGVAQTRLTKDGSVIIMHTRWHKKDLAGHVISQGQNNPLASQFEVLCFPAAYDPDHPYCSPIDQRTYKGEALWPNFREDDEELERLRADVGARTWAALFRQSPTVEGGNIIKEEDIQLYQKLPIDLSKLKSSMIIQSWDAQFKETGSSFTVGVTFLKQGADFYLVDFYRQKAGIVESQRAIQAMSDRWPQCNTILIEDKANGPAIIELLKRKISGIIAVKPEASKDERLHLVAPFFEAKNVHLPANHPKLKTIIEELTEFPNSENDDIVDAISQALSRFTKLKGLRYLEAYRT